MSTILYQGSHTRTLSSASLSILAAENVSRFTVLCQSGTCTILGNVSYGGVASSPITLQAGQSYTVSANAYSFLDGYTITAVGGDSAIDIQK